MPINKAQGNMYEWVDATWNPIQGPCPHACSYCYGRRIWAMQGLKKMVLKEGYFRDDLGSGARYFVGSTTDMWLADKCWIHRVLDYLKAFPGNVYHLQSKDPSKMIGWIFPKDTTAGTTIETDDAELCRQHSQAPYPGERVAALVYLKKYMGVKTMVSIEPVMEFNLPRLVNFIRIVEPEFVSIGADSKGHHLPEPSTLKLGFLIQALQEFTEVKIKPNLGRLLSPEQIKAFTKMEGEKGGAYGS